MSTVIAANGAKMLLPGGSSVVIPLKPIERRQTQSAPPNHRTRVTEDTVWMWYPFVSANIDHHTRPNPDHDFAGEGSDQDSMKPQVSSVSSDADDDFTSKTSDLDSMQPQVASVSTDTHNHPGPIPAHNFASQESVQHPIQPHVSSLPPVPDTTFTFRHAQKRYPGKACIFVGNLPGANFDDAELAVVVKREFSVFGRCYVRVVRLKKNGGPWMPHAYVQFTNIFDAKEALKNGRELEFDGRLFRTEPSRAKRSINVGCRNGSVMPATYDTCRKLSRFGEIESQELCRMYDGMVPYQFLRVTFVTYGAYMSVRNAIGTFTDPMHWYLA